MLPRRTLTSAKFARRRRKILIWKIVGTIVVISGLIVGFFSLTRLAAFSITTITVKGNTVTTNADIEAIADSYLDQYTWRFIPRRDTFFLQESEIEAAIKSKWLRVNSVIVSRDGLHGITITLDEKIPESIWCGSSQAQFLATATSSCYFMDDTSYIFDQVPAAISIASTTGSTTSAKIIADTSSTVDLFKFYGTYSTSTAATSTPAASVAPLGAYYTSKTQFDYMNSFVAAFSQTGTAFHLTPIAILKTNQDEGEVLLNSGLRIFISDKEDVTESVKNVSDFLNSLSTLSGTSTKSVLTLSGIDYIDARYDNKIYYMPK